MKIKDLIYQTPELSEEKLLEIITKHLDTFRLKTKHLTTRIQQIHKYSDSIPNLILKEFDLIQEKKSYLSKSERDLVTGFVGTCLIEMTKGEKEDEYVDFEEVTDGRPGNDTNTEETISETPSTGNA